MFKEKLKLVPELPGSYQMKDINNNIIYVGKAKNLKRRLKSYFTRNVYGKTKKLVSEIHDFEYIVTKSELESLILEITLIKKYNPKYNILLKDDKSYPYIELTKDKYPTLKIVRNVNLKKNKSNLYGPFPNVGSAKRTVSMLNRLYPLRKCENLKKDYCLYYHLGECLGYCKNEVDLDKLKQMIDEITSFLNGDSTSILKKLNEKMLQASNAMNFEKALEYKNMIDDIKITLKNQTIVLNKDIHLDIFNYYEHDSYLAIQVFFIRSGTLFERHQKIIEGIDKLENIIEYIINFYDKHILPKEILVPDTIDAKILEDYFHIKVRTPLKGDLKKLLDLAYENAKIYLETREKTIKNDEEKRLEAVRELASLLNIKSARRIEAFDNSHLFGTFYVSGMVVFEDFLPLKNEYRKYKIDLDSSNDLKAMEEVIYRRYQKVLVENLTHPDLIIVDGGKTQIEVAKNILTELNLEIEVIGLVKDDKHRTRALINSNLEIIEIPKTSNLFLFLAKIQEEVHNYAITYHRTIKNKGDLASMLENIPGIGVKRRKELLKEFHSLKKIKEATIEELEKYLPYDIAINLKEYLNNN